MEKMDAPKCNCTLCQLCAARTKIEQSRDFDELLKYCDNIETLWLDAANELEMLKFNMKEGEK